jgi:chromosome segregation ATPase
MDLVKRATQLDWELGRKRAELSRLESELAERERALADYQDALDAFQRRFGHALANHYVELDELEAQIAERAAQLRPDDASKRRKAERLRAKVESRHQPAPHRPAEPAGKPQASEAARKLYRDFTKLAHPDLETDPEAKACREAAMVQANAAYAAGDVETLRYMLGVWNLEASGPEPDDPESVLARIERQIDQTAGRLDAPEKAREELEASDIGRLMRRAVLAERQGRDLLDRLLEEADEMKREARKRLKTLERRLGKAAKKGRSGDDDPDGEM